MRYDAVYIDVYRRCAEKTPRRCAMTHLGSISGIVGRKPSSCARQSASTFSCRSFVVCSSLNGAVVGTSTTSVAVLAANDSA